MDTSKNSQSVISKALQSFNNISNEIIFTLPRTIPLTVIRETPLFFANTACVNFLCFRILPNLFPIAFIYSILFPFMNWLYHNNRQLFNRQSSEKLFLCSITDHNGCTCKTLVVFSKIVKNIFYQSAVFNIALLLYS